MVRYLEKTGASATGGGGDQEFAREASIVMDVKTNSHRNTEFLVFYYMKSRNFAFLNRNGWPEGYANSKYGKCGT